MREKIEDLEIKHTNSLNELSEKVKSPGPSGSSAADPWHSYLSRAGKGVGKGVGSSEGLETSDGQWSGLWILGNLGFDTEPSELLQRARATLSTLEGFVVADQVKDIRTTLPGPGSQVIVEFITFEENSSEARRLRGHRGLGTVYYSPANKEIGSSRP